MSHEDSQRAWLTVAGMRVKGYAMEYFLYLVSVLGFDKKQYRLETILKR